MCNKKIARKHHTKETKAKISIALKGRKKKPRSMEHRRNLSESLKGRKAWNKGISHTEETKRKISQGNTNPSEETREKMSNGAKKRWASASDEYKEKTLTLLKKQGGWNKGQPHSKETIEKIRLKSLNRKIPLTDTSIEQKVKEQLEEGNFEFEHPWILNNKFQCDFFLPILNLIIECDGLYWHSREKIVRKDKSENMYAITCGYRMLRISDKVINSKNFNILKIIDNISKEYKIEGIELYLPFI